MSMFSHSHGFQVANSNITNIDQRISTVNVHNVHNTVDHVENTNRAPSGAGLRELLAHSIPSATHDSSERYPPPLCHPGTREDFISLLTEWGRNTSQDHPRLAWMKGPAGVGKSAIAQSTALALGDDVGATFFFSRPNHRNNPYRFFTSIAHQLAMKHEAFGDFLDQKIHRNPTIVTKSLQFQFDELLIAPVRALKQQGKGLPDMAIFVDGLDECSGQGAQQEIVLLVAKSIRDEDTPFRWIFFSRLEPVLVSTFDRPEVKPFTAQFELTVTRELDPQIHHFLASRLREIREKHGLGESWPTGKDLRALVDISAGLFACAHAIALYIEDPEDATIPKKQLEVVLGLTSRIKVERSSKHPLSSLDLFYMLILERLHPERFTDVQLILLATCLELFQSSSTQIMTYANLLGHSPEDFFIICKSLHAVMKVDSKHITFYHASFMDFIDDPARSAEQCVWSACPRLLRHVMQSLHNIRLSSDFYPIPSLSWQPPKVTRVDFQDQYENLCGAFFELFRWMIMCKIQDDETYRLVKEFDLRRLVLAGHVNVDSGWYDIDRMLPQLKLVQLNGFIRPLRLKNAFESYLRPFCKNRDHFRKYLVGTGRKIIILKTSTPNNPRVSLSSAEFHEYSRGMMEKLKKKLRGQDGEYPWVYKVDESMAESSVT
ncbi:hypothetical protein D9756_002924 [Leucocoprinus leucothites]|uniref:Nephrocystin 3-like N-terminal domain-containing protein n=1 Tax=Leucocoprinus leucothites TaxID=201217 RepID=A0A8H5G7V7_9AGAR|nr:hypothetical protein D9756_002924 [Leucoagaricus leucothites]